MVYLLVWFDAIFLLLALPFICLHEWRKKNGIFVSVCLNLSCHLSPHLSSPKCENYQVTIWIIETLLRKRALLTLLQSSRIIDLVIASMPKNGSSSVKSDNPVAAVVIFFPNEPAFKTWWLEDIKFGDRWNPTWDRSLHGMQCPWSVVIRREHLKMQQ